MNVTVEITKCKECPYFEEHCECGYSSAYCSHPKAHKSINGQSAYMHVDTDRIPRDSISSLCPLK